MEITDAGVAAADAAPLDAIPCTPDNDTDGDSVDDCIELGDGDPFTDPLVFNGLTAVIGDRPEVTGTCNSLDDRAEMLARFDAPMRSLDVHAGWEFDTDADDYADPSFGFAPNWSESDSGRFSLRFTGAFNAALAGTYCFHIDIGATGTGIITGKNMCGQIYVGDDTGWLVESGFAADTADADAGCVDLTAGAHKLDIVFWYFNIFERAQLRTRFCRTDTGTCAPDAPIAPEVVRVSE